VSYSDLLVDSCQIYTRTVDTSGMTDLEAWAAGTTVPCRVLKRAATLFNAEKTQHTTAIKSRFALQDSVATGSKLLHEGRFYDVVEVIEPFNRQQKHHVIAVCELLTGAALQEGSLNGDIITASYNETPSGSVNDSNTVFTIANEPITGTLLLFLNGLLQKEGDDYTRSGLTITFILAPPTGSTLLAHYVSEA
jgi:hypothetical protein